MVLSYHISKIDMMKKIKQLSFLDFEENVDKQVVPIISFSKKSCGNEIYKNDNYVLYQYQESNEEKSPSCKKIKNINAVKCLNPEIQNIQEVLDSACMIGEHPCIKTPLGRTSKSNEKNPCLFYNFNELGSLMAVLNYLDNCTEGQAKCPFVWDMNNNYNQDDDPYNDDDVPEAKAPKSQSLHLSYVQKMKILLGLAAGSYYLKNTCQSYNFLFPNKIFLNNNFEPVIADTEIQFNQPEEGSSLKFFTATGYDCDKNHPLDVYSFGIIAIWLLSECRPFHYCSVDNALFKLVHGQIPLVPGSIPPELSTILMHCLEQKVKRQPTFKQIALCLGQLKLGSEYEAYKNRVLPPSLLATIDLIPLLGDDYYNQIFENITKSKEKEKGKEVLRLARTFIGGKPKTDLALTLCLAAGKLGSDEGVVNAISLLLNDGRAEEALKLARTPEFVDRPAIAVFLAEMHAKGVGGQKKPQLAIEALKEAKKGGTFAAAFEYGRFTAEGVSEAARETQGRQMMVDATKEADASAVSLFFAQLLEMPYFDDFQLLFDMAHELGDVRTQCALMTALQRQHSTVPKDGFWERLVELARPSLADPEQSTDQEPIKTLKLWTSRGLDRDCAEDRSFAKLLTPEQTALVDSFQSPPTTFQAFFAAFAESPEAAVAAFAETFASASLIRRSPRGIADIAEEGRRLREGEDPLGRAHAALAGFAADDDVSVERLLMESGREEAEYELALFRLARGLITFEAAKKILTKEDDSAVRLNALAYYFRRCEKNNVKCEECLERAASLGFAPAKQNLAEMMMRKRQTDPAVISRIEELLEDVREHGSPFEYGYFLSL